MEMNLTIPRKLQELYLEICPTSREQLMEVLRTLDPEIEKKMHLYYAHHDDPLQIAVEQIALKCFIEDNSDIMELTLTLKAAMWHKETYGRYWNN